MTRTTVFAPAALVATTLLLAACSPAVDPAVVDGLREVEASAAGYDAPGELPEPPEDITTAHRASLGAFQALCSELNNRCLDAIAECNSCDVGDAGTTSEILHCLRICGRVGPICDSAKTCESHFRDAVAVQAPPG